MVYCISLPGRGTSITMDEGAGFLAGGPVGFSTFSQAWGLARGGTTFHVCPLSCIALLLLLSRDLSHTEKSGS